VGDQPTTNNQQPDTHRYWLQYRKVGAATLLGHLDLLRHLILLFRRAKLPLDYSKGFHPRAKLFFPQPLALGMFGVAEWMEVVLTKPVDDSVLDALNRASFEGLVFQRVREVQDPKEKISRAMQADYQIALSDKSCSVEEFLTQAAALEWPHLVSPFQPSPAATAWWPASTDPTRVLTFRWGLGQAPRPDRTLVNAIPGLELLWTARTQLLWPPG
jgi:hypothetical protein